MVVQNKIFSKVALEKGDGTREVRGIPSVCKHLSNQARRSLKLPLHAPYIRITDALSKISSCTLSLAPYRHRPIAACRQALIWTAEGLRRWATLILAVADNINCSFGRM